MCEHVLLASLGLDPGALFMSRTSERDTVIGLTDTEYKISLYILTYTFTFTFRFMQT